MTNQLKIGYLWQNEQADMEKITAGVQHIRAVIEKFKERGHQVRLVTMPQGRHQWSDDLMEWQAADLGSAATHSFHRFEKTMRRIQGRLQLPYVNYFDSYRFAQAACSALNGYDVLYERYWLLNYGGLLASRRLGIPLVLEMNGDLFAEYHDLGFTLSKVQWAAIRMINQHLVHQAAHIITVSEPLRLRVIERWRLDPTKVTAVENGAHVELFDNSTDSPHLRSQFSVNGEPVIIFVGSFRSWHGIDLLIDAFKNVADQDATAKLMLVGDGPLRAEIEAKVGALQLCNRVIFTGKVPHQDVVSLLGIAQIAVMSHPPSLAATSGSPLKLFEYMAAGKAIVAPSLPNITRVLAHRTTGYLVPPADPDALTKGLLELLNDRELQTNLGCCARKQALAHHSWHQTAARLEAILYDVSNK